MIGLLTKPRTNIKNKQKHNTGTINQHPILSANIFSSRNLILIIIDRWDKDSIIRPLIVISLSAISLVSFHFSLLSSCNNQKPRFRQFRQVNFLFLRIKFCECLGGWTALSSHILQSGSHLSSTALKVTSDEISRTQTHYYYTGYCTLPIGFPISGNHSGEQAGWQALIRFIGPVLSSTPPVIPIKYLHQTRWHTWSPESDLSQ